MPQLAELSCEARRGVHRSARVSAPSAPPSVPPSAPPVAPPSSARERAWGVKRGRKAWLMVLLVAPRGCVANDPVRRQQTFVPLPCHWANLKTPCWRAVRVERRVLGPAMQSVELFSPPPRPPYPPTPCLPPFAPGKAPRSPPSPLPPPAAPPAPPITPPPSQPPPLRPPPSRPPPSVPPLPSSPPMPPIAPPPSPPPPWPPPSLPPWEPYAGYLSPSGVVAVIVGCLVGCCLLVVVSIWCLTWRSGARYRKKYGLSQSV